MGLCLYFPKEKSRSSSFATFEEVCKVKTDASENLPHILVKDESESQNYSIFMSVGATHSC